MSFEQRRLNHQEVAISGGPTAGPDANPDGTASAIDYSQSAGGVIGPYHLLRKRSAKAAWARCGWPSRRSRFAAASRSS